MIFRREPSKILDDTDGSANSGQTSHAVETEHRNESVLELGEEDGSVGKVPTEQTGESQHNPRNPGKKPCAALSVCNHSAGQERGRACGLRISDS